MKKHETTHSNKDLKIKVLSEEDVFKWAKLKECSVVVPKMPDWAVNLIENRKQVEKVQSRLKNVKGDHWDKKVSEINNDNTDINIDCVKFIDYRNNCLSYFYIG